MLIDKKDVFIERSNWWLEDPGQPIDLGKIRAPVSGGFYQASCGIEGFLEIRKIRLKKKGLDKRIRRKKDEQSGVNRRGKW